MPETGRCGDRKCARFACRRLPTNDACRHWGRANRIRSKKIRAIPYDHTFANAVPFNVTAAQGQAPVSLVVGGLACGTTYHFRVTADDMNGRPVVGGDLTFRTNSCPLRPVVPVPTLAQWNLLALAGMIAAVAWWQRRRSRIR